MTSEQEWKKWFESQRADFPDEGFSRNVARRLPQRKSMLPQAVMLLCVFAGFALTFAIQGVMPIIEHLYALVSAVSQLQIPSAASVATYLGGVAILGLTGFAVATTE
ncbi:MAG: DUF5056 domain-containing protein [Bacteroidales bacterium]|jgi:hypothetical protein|nr:DUF5056 domain-containing protein [Bacteroidales bacterium]